jgi:hypothetical protein
VNLNNYQEGSFAVLVSDLIIVPVTKSVYLLNISMNFISYHEDGCSGILAT